MPAAQPAGVRVVALVGNPKPGSRTAGVATSLAELTAAALDDAAPTAGHVDLAGLGPAVVDPQDPAHASASAEVAAADVLIVATPVYKASFTGLLKVFLDSYRGGAWTGTVAVPVTVAAGNEHRLLADAALRPVLAALGASTPTPGLTLIESELVHAAERAHDWAAKHLPTVAAVAAATRTPDAAAVPS